MIRKQFFCIALLASLFLCGNSFLNGAMASETFSIKYATVCANTERLEVIGADLRTAFASDFRQSGVYRKLAWNAGKLKRQSARLHRQGTNKSNCRWDKQIGRLDEVVCSLEKLTAEAHARIAHKIDPACHNSVVYVDNMLREAKELILGLHVATGTAGPEYETDRIIIEDPIQTPSFEVAPDYNPAPPSVIELNPPLQAPLPSDSAPFIGPEFQGIPDIPMEAPLRAPLGNPPLNNPFGAPGGAIIVPEDDGSASRSVLNRRTVIPAQQSLKPAGQSPVFDGPPLTGPLDTRGGSYDTAKALKKLNSK